MNRITLYTYEGIQQFNNLYKQAEREGKGVYPFVYDEIGTLLDEEGDKILDISALVENLRTTPGSLIFATAQLGHLDETFQVIIKSELAEMALNYFPTVFDRVALLEGKAKMGKSGARKVVTNRNVLYTYINTDQLEKLFEFADLNQIPFASSSTLFSAENENFKERAIKQKKSIIDITSLVQATSSNPQLIFHTEQILGLFPFFDAIVREEYVEQALDTFRFLFISTKPIHDLYGEISLNTDVQKHQEGEKVIRVTDFDSLKRELLFDELNKNLIGHLEFKHRFVSAVEDFVVLNKLKERKVLSVFLLGSSGLGKTEVARLINHSINPTSPLAKINFGNYSSKDALNSLIGSPRGYIGSEDGELSVKIRRSKVGILLCDEFEKATRPIFDFFLELLEDGHFTDSIAREFDLEGYIVIFTGNINEKQFNEQIPPELRSRFDLVCEFTPLSRSEKIEFAEYQVTKFLEKLDESKRNLLSFEDLLYFKAVNIDSTDNLRDIKRMIQERVTTKMRSNGFFDAHTMATN